MRSKSELMGLEWEAERLVRSGESRAQVSRMLGVHPQTLACWALKGGWRKKDLDLNRSGAETRRTIRNVVEGHKRRDLERELLEAQVLAYREAFRLISEQGTGADLTKLLEGLRELPKLAPPEPPAADPTAAGTPSLAQVGPDAGAADEPEADQVDWGEDSWPG